jgi:hypothetical protein
LALVAPSVSDFGYAVDCGIGIGVGSDFGSDGDTGSANRRYRP